MFCIILIIIFISVIYINCKNKKKQLDEERKIYFYVILRTNDNGREIARIDRQTLDIYLYRAENQINNMLKMEPDIYKKSCIENSILQLEKFIIVNSDLFNKCKCKKNKELEEIIYNFKMSLVNLENKKTTLKEINNKNELSDEDAEIDNMITPEENKYGYLKKEDIVPQEVLIRQLKAYIQLVRFLIRQIDCNNKSVIFLQDLLESVQLHNCIDVNTIELEGVNGFSFEREVYGSSSLDNNSISKEPFSVWELYQEDIYSEPMEVKKYLISQELGSLFGEMDNSKEMFCENLKNYRKNSRFSEINKEYFYSDNEMEYTNKFLDNLSTNLKPSPNIYLNKRQSLVSNFIPPTTSIEMETRKRNQNKIAKIYSIEELRQGQKEIKVFVDKDAKKSLREDYRDEELLD